MRGSRLNRSRKPSCRGQQLDRAPVRLGREGGAGFEREPPWRIAGEQGDQQRRGADRGEEQPAERLLGGDGVEDEVIERRQQDAERAAGGDQAGGEARGVAASAASPGMPELPIAEQVAARDPAIAANRPQATRRRSAEPAGECGAARRGGAA